MILHSKSRAAAYAILLETLHPNTHMVIVPAIINNDTTIEATLAAGGGSAQATTSEPSNTSSHFCRVAMDSDALCVNIAGV